MRSRLSVEYDIVTVEHAGLLIRGRIKHRSGSDIGIEILEPFSGLSSDRHIPYFARRWRDFHGVYGDEVAECLLRRVYLTGKFLKESIASLRAGLLVLDHKIAGYRARDDYLSEEQLASETRELRSRFKRCEFDQTEYQESRKRLSGLWSKSDLELRRMRTDFVAQHIARPLGRDSVPIDARELLAFIQDASS